MQLYQRACFKKKNEKHVHQIETNGKYSKQNIRKRILYMNYKKNANAAESQKYSYSFVLQMNF